MNPGIKKYKWQGLSTAPLPSFNSWKGLSGILNNLGVALVPAASPRKRERFVQRVPNQNVRAGRDVEVSATRQKRRIVRPIIVAVSKFILAFTWAAIKLAFKLTRMSVIGWCFIIRDTAWVTLQSIRVARYLISECTASTSACDDDPIEREFGRQALLLCAAQLRRRKNRFLSPGSRIAKFFISSLDEALTVAVRYGDMTETAAAQLLAQQAARLEIDIVDSDVVLPLERETVVAAEPVRRASEWQVFSHLDPAATTMDGDNGRAVPERERPFDTVPEFIQDVPIIHVSPEHLLDEPPQIVFEDDDRTAEEVQSFLDAERETVPDKDQHDGYR